MILLSLEKFEILLIILYIIINTLNKINDQI
jgi:hypothetical protein